VGDPLTEQTATFATQVSFGDGWATVRVSGDVDVLTAGTLAGTLTALIDDGYHDLTIDISRVIFSDAAGLDAIVGIARRARERGGSVVVQAATEVTDAILDITGARELITFDPATPATGLGAEQTAAAANARDDAVDRPARSPAFVRSSTEVVDAALRLVTSLADATVTNADGVSVTLERHGQLVTVAASNDKVLQMDSHQYETGQGPCLAAKADGRWFYIESLDQESRWPDFVPLALGQGIRSILSSPLMANDRPQGALNIYSSKVNAFGTAEQHLAELFADQASEILTTAGSHLDDTQANRRFAEALSARQTINRAQGLVMHRDAMTGEAATAAMPRTSRTLGLTVLQYAQQLLDTVTGPKGTGASDG
jgi:anti-anti-sigma factor